MVEPTVEPKVPTTADERDLHLAAEKADSRVA
jgi:hypothetical protein